MTILIAYLSQIEFRLLGQQFQIVEEGIIYCYYYEQLQQWLQLHDRLSSCQKEFHIASSNAFYDQIILAWCKIFGSDNEPCHYKNLIKQQSIKKKLIQINSELTDNNKLLKFLLEGKNIDDYSNYHKNTKSYRDQYLIHREHAINKVWDGKLAYPETNIAKKLIIAYYFLLIEILKQYPDTNTPQHIYTFHRPIVDDIATLYRHLDKSLVNIIH